MVRTLRPLGRRWLSLVTLTSVSCASLTAGAADPAFDSHSTLAPQVAPQEFSIDATIASMVRRGLLADVTPTTDRVEQAPQPTALPSTPIISAPILSTPITPTPSPRISESESTWRAQGSTPPRVATATPAPLMWRPSGTSAEPVTAPTLPAPSLPSLPTLPTQSSPDLEFPDLPPTDEPALDEVEAPAVEPAGPTHSAPILAPPAPPAPIQARPLAVAPIAIPPLGGSASTAAPTPQPQRVALREAEPTETEEPVEPPTSDDPLPDESLAPIDELSETPAPAHDAPGDAREPEIGDEDLEGVLAPQGPAGSTPKGAAPPAGSSISGQSMTPVGEPDRIEQPSASISPPSNPEQYQEADDLAPARNLRPLTRNQVALRNKVRSVLKYYYEHPLNTGDRSPWEVMHCMLSYEVHSRVLKGGPNGDPITTVGWLCFNQPCKGRTLMYLNQDGDMRVKVGPALQGHHGQLLALLAQARVRTDYPMQVEGKDFTVADLIEVEKSTCYPNTELTFKLIGLQRYLDINAQWMNDQGMQWNFPTLLREEMKQPVRTAACGGTHRLSGLILTVKKRQRSGLPVDGEYAAAQKFVANYANYAYRLQNTDGSFSTEWFKGPGAEEDIDRRLKTTGHQLEFLIYASPDNQLTNQKLVKAVNYLSNIMWANRGRDWEAGPLGHAIHALVLYDRLMFAPYDDNPGTAPSAVAQKPQPTRKAPTQQQRRTRR
jgi:hypothetical protein